MRNLLLLALLTALTACAEGQAGLNGGTCGLKLAGDVPIEFRNNQALVTMSTPGGHALMLVDTGAGISELRQTAVDQLHLAVVAGGALQFFGTGGASTAKVAVVNGASLGTMSLPSLKIPVPPDAEAGISGPIGGVLGMDLMGRYEVDLDIPGRRLRFYAGAPCAGEVTPMGPAAVDIRGTWTAQPSLNHQDPRMFVRVTLQGRETSALLDTGSQHSILYGDAAPLFGITPGMLAQDPAIMVRGVGASLVRAPRHVLPNLQIGPTSVQSLEAWVMPRPYKGEVNDTSAMIVGMDYLQNHRVWIAFQRDTVLVAP